MKNIVPQAHQSSPETENPIDDCAWKPCGWSGAAYRALRMIFSNPSSHPRVLKALFNGGIFKGILVEHAATKARLLLDHDDYIANEILVNGGYEPLTHLLALRLLKNGGTFVDVGANIGLFSLPAALIPNVRVISVDGSIPALSRLWRNSKCSMAELTIVAGLIGDAKGLSELRLPCSTNLGSARMANELGSTYINHASFVSISDLLSLAGNEAVELIKIDIEGQEWALIQQLPLTGPLAPRNIIVELWEHNPTCRVVFEFLKSHGYTARTVSGQVLESLSEVPESNVWFQKQPC